VSARHEHQVGAECETISVRGRRGRWFLNDDPGTGEPRGVTAVDQRPQRLRQILAQQRSTGEPPGSSRTIAFDKNRRGDVDRDSPISLTITAVSEKAGDTKARRK